MSSVRVAARRPGDRRQRARARARARPACARYNGACGICARKVCAAVELGCTIVAPDACTVLAQLETAAAALQAARTRSGRKAAALAASALLDAFVMPHCDKAGMATTLVATALVRAVWAELVE